MVQSLDFKIVCEVIGNENIDSPNNPGANVSSIHSQALLDLSFFCCFSSLYCSLTSVLKKYLHLYPVVTTSDSPAIKIIKPIVPTKLPSYIPYKCLL